jgi:hypothetical protein
MSFKDKYSNKKDESEFDEVQRLMCSVSGCNKRWTVHISGDRPKCSEHQWATEKPAFKRDITELLPKTEVEVPQWWNKDDF